ncbi:MAG: YraN family protein [Planctomycetaceae bacterium]
MRGWLRKLLGDRGERRAARYLRGLGYRILARQYANRFGEIDLIALDGERIVFVEVKTRTSDAAGLPVEAVDFRKQRQLTRVALAYLKRHGLLERPARFDVLALLWPNGAKSPEITHYQNAFEPVGFGQMFS